MAELTFKEMAGRVLSRIGEQVDEMVVRAEIDNAFRHLTTTYPWTIKKTYGQLVTTAEYATGTFSATNNSATITGSGTTFTSGMVGRLFIAGDYPYTIGTYTSGTSIDLNTAWADTDTSGASYSIRQHLYELATDVSYILTASSQYRLRELSIHQLENIDPSRQESGDPTHFVYRGWGTNGRVIELWPTPIATHVISYVGATNGSLSLTSPTTAMEDIFMNVVLNFATSSCCQVIANHKESAFWAQSSMRYRQEAQAMLEDARWADLAAWGATKVARDIDKDFLYSDDFIASHDLDVE